MVFLYIEIHHYRQLLRFSPDTLTRLESQVRSLAAAASAQEYSGINGGRFLFAFGEGQDLKNRPRAMDLVYNAALRCEAALRTESHELYGY
ncbi:MAG: hypothetical protein LC641_12550, partial [Spirochaeta sp.]|nr:hypothetical protein [Spirochaeta sp.]